MVIRIVMITLSLFLFLGCGDDNKSSKNALTNLAPVEVVDESSLTRRLLQLAGTTDTFDDFSGEALKSVLNFSIQEYVPSLFQDYVLGSDFFSVENLLGNDTILSSLKDFYSSSTSSEKSKNFSQFSQKTEEDNVTEPLGLVETILNEIKNILSDWLGLNFFDNDSNTTNDESDSNWFFDNFFTNDESNTTQNGFSLSLDYLSDIAGGISDTISDGLDFLFGDDEVFIDDANYTIDPDAPVGFKIGDIQGKNFYVISAIADMDVEMALDGKSGSGAMGILSMDFTTSIDANEDLLINTDVMGNFKIVMTYFDPGYCIAATAYDAQGAAYDSYWFSSEIVKKQANNIREAKSLCLAHSANFVPIVEIDEGPITPIDDIRTGHAPQTGTSTTNIVDNLLNSVTKVANYIDAKYFVRQLRHGVLGIYTTNNQTHTLQEKETQNIMRELMPLGASSAIGMKDLLTEAFDTSLAFKDELDSDLNGTFNSVNSRLTALINTATKAMEATMDDAGLSGGSGISNDNPYGDSVEFHIYDTDVNICIFFCSSSVDARVAMLVKNSGYNGNYADIGFQTTINATDTNINSINFSQVDSLNGQTNRIQGEGYNLNITGFKFSRSNGTLDLEGTGTVEQITNASEKTKVILDDYKMRIFLKEQGALNFVFNGISANLDGTIDTASGKNFIGKLYFDGINSDSNEMNGTITNNALKIKGEMKASLSYHDIDVWMNGHEDQGMEDGIPYFINDNGGKELIKTLTNIAGRIQAQTFDTFNNSFDCQKVQEGEYRCNETFKPATKTMKFTTPEELLQVSTNNGEYYILNIRNVFSYSLSELVLMNLETRKVVTLGEFNYKDADISNVRIASSDINGPVGLNDLGDQNFLMNVEITKNEQRFSADMKMSYKESQNQWTYNVYNLNAKDEYGTIKADEINVVQSGENKLLDLATDIISGKQSLDIGMESLLNLGWSSLEGFDYIGFDGFTVSMDAGLGEANIQTQAHLTNQDTTITGDVKFDYTYGQTTLVSQGDVNVAVSKSGETTHYDNAFQTTGTISAEDIQTYEYALDYTDATRSLLFTRQDTGYQMGFLMNGSDIKGADSYGVKSTFKTNDALDVIQSFELTNKEDKALGSYEQSTDPLKVYYDDGETEYLYLY